MIMLGFRDSGDLHVFLAGPKSPLLHSSAVSAAQVKALVQEQFALVHCIVHRAALVR